LFQGSDTYKTPGRLQSPYNSRFSLSEQFRKGIREEREVKGDTPGCPAIKPALID
jgi:hypothetical protein